MYMSLSLIPIDIMDMYLFLWCFFMIKTYQKWIYKRMGFFSFT